MRQVAVTKADQAPTLRSIIPYLEASNNQEYLVQRLSGLFKKKILILYLSIAESEKAYFSIGTVFPGID